LRYLITGGAGFIGSHLAESLLDRGDHVVLLDNLSTGSVENIRHLKSSDRMQYHLDSLENRQLLAELVDDADIVVHLAAAVGVKLIVESPVKTIETNVNGTQLILEAACKKKKLVLTASTSEVYGKNTNVPFREDADLVLGPTTKGRWSYAASRINCVPFTLVSMVLTGLSTMSLTPTAAARWTTTSASSTSSASSWRFSILSS